MDTELCSTFDKMTFAMSAKKKKKKDLEKKVKHNN